MKIGIIGSGHIGGNLGKHWAKAGHEVLFSSRHPKELDHLAHEAGNNAKAVSVTEAFEANADAYLLATPFKAIDQISEKYAGEYGDKVIIDATNPYPERDGEMAQEVRNANYNATEYTAMKFNTAKTIKAFNTIKAEDLKNQAFRHDNKLSVPFAAQDEESKTIGKQLIEDIGFDAYYVGSLSDSNIMDPDQEIYGKSLEIDKLKKLVIEAREY
ncbi:NADPH-dependent F420 reductase [Xanthomarina sp. F2636L]|uniref:NADPH-dependent F420 reductase n=1 Tax=Xanthomarina sp. F2636L TaxID=2996018 RepID=UPI00225E6C55|nr:NAD(P)-binding domain-containing protein [Xanthomarina sp. F2636L]MCX7550076.1 NAD(P)-binding domain-containing protein [Xanthomarina sp. F2636L]